MATASCFCSTSHRRVEGVKSGSGEHLQVFRMAFQPPPTGAPPPISSQPPASAPPPATAPPPPMSAPPSTGTPPPVSAPPQLLAGLQPPSTKYPPMLKVAEGYSCYISNVSPACDEAFIKEIFTTIGGFQEWQGVTDPVTGKIRGFGFVKFTTPKYFRRAISILDGFEIDNKKIKVKVDAATKFRLEQLEQSQGTDGSTDEVVEDGEAKVANKGEDGELQEGEVSSEVDELVSIKTKLDDIVKNREAKLKEMLGYSGDRYNRNGLNSNGKRARSVDDSLEEELRKRKQQRSIDERNKAVEQLVCDFYGSVDHEVVTFLIDTVMKSPSCGMEKLNIRADLKLLFAEDLPWVLQRLKNTMTLEK